MYLKSLHIHNYRMFKDVRIDFKKQELDSTTYTVFPVASLNGGGKSTLLQFIFTMLHCAFDEERQPYLANLFKDEEFEFAEGQKEIPVATFELEVKKESVNMNFSVISYRTLTASKLLPLGKKLLQELKATNDNLKEVRPKSQGIPQHLLAQGELAVIQENWLNDVFKGGFIEELTMLEVSKQLEQIRKHTDGKSTRSVFGAEVYLRSALLEMQTIIEISVNILSKESVSIYSEISLNSEEAYLVQSKEVIGDYQKLVTNKMYLAAPRTQPFHFLPKKAKDSLFYPSQEKENYEWHLTKVTERMPNLFLYQFANPELIKKVFLEARDEDFKAVIRGEEGWENFKKLKKELEEFMDGISVSIAEDLEHITFKSTNTNAEFEISSLSHGQLKRLSLFVWLKHVVKKDALVLIDEIDIALHPRWQYDISAEISEWAQNSQFLLATHSPQIISANPAANTVVLQKEGETIRALSQKRREDSDINTVLHDIMGSINYRPKVLDDKKERYMALVENGKVDSDEAKKLKKFILAFEGLDSDFFQEIDFMLDPELDD